MGSYLEGIDGGHSKGGVQGGARGLSLLRGSKGVKHSKGLRRDENSKGSMKDEDLRRDESLREGEGSKEGAEVIDGNLGMVWRAGCSCCCLGWASRASLGPLSHKNLGSRKGEAFGGLKSSNESNCSESNASCTLQLFAITNSGYLSRSEILSA